MIIGVGAFLLLVAAFAVGSLIADVILATYVTLRAAKARRDQLAKLKEFEETLAAAGADTAED